jgi:hypothetical protein
VLSSCEDSELFVLFSQIIILHINDHYTIVRG